MNKLLEIFSDVIRIATLQAVRTFRRDADEANRFDDMPMRFRCERRGGERFFG